MALHDKSLGCCSGCFRPSLINVVLVLALARCTAEDPSGQRERQPGPADAVYWDAVYAESARAGVKNFARAWQGLNWTALQKATHFYLRPEDRVLVLGAGDSFLPQRIFDEGCRNVTATDFSPVLVAAMSERGHGVLWRVEDARRLSFQNNSFDTVLDVGLLDSVGASGDDQMSAVILEAIRVLSPRGTYISASTEPPLYRLPLFAQILGVNATKVLFFPRPRQVDHRVRRIDPALDMGMLSIYVSAKDGAQATSPTFTVELPWPFGINYSYGYRATQHLKIDNVVENGSVAEYNSRQELGRRILPGDYVVELNGKVGHDDMIAESKRADIEGELGKVVILKKKANEEPQAAEDSDATQTTSGKEPELTTAV